MAFTRNFVIAGRLGSHFNVDTGIPETYLSGLEVELWKRTSLDIHFLGRGTTNEDGRFVIEVESNSPFIEDGKIKDTFLRVYYNGELINAEDENDCDTAGSYNDDFSYDFDS